VPEDWASRFLDDRDGGRWIAMLNRGLARVHRHHTELFAESDACLETPFEISSKIARATSGSPPWADSTAFVT
jgi:hypothetical protein